MNDEYTQLWKAFISTLDEDVVTWKASPRSLAVSLLEVFDEWLEKHEEFHQQILHSIEIKGKKIKHEKRNW